MQGKSEFRFRNLRARDCPAPARAALAAVPSLGCCGANAPVDRHSKLDSTYVISAMSRPASFLLRLDAR